LRQLDVKHPRFPKMPSRLRIFAAIRGGYAQSLRSRSPDIHESGACSAAIGRDSEGQGKQIMSFWSRCARFALAVREFLIPTYRPERHYMRGPGPACARRGGGFGPRATFQ
jgi:hypothetical protein